jgi:hypothetical protein
MNNERNDNKDIQNQKSENELVYKKKEENEFNKLLNNNRTFKKFLCNKIKYYIKGSAIPYKFINSLEIPHEKAKKHQNNISHDNHFLNYANFYDSKNNLSCKGPIKYEKNSKDIFNTKSINLSDKTNYEKLEIENYKKTHEIKKLKERINDQKKIIIEKKEIIDELQTINHNLEQKIFYLKNYNSNYKNYNTINSEGNKFYMKLDYEKLINRRNKLIKIRDKTNEEYFNLCNKKENHSYRNMLEKKLDKINGSLIEIRNQLKIIKY